jgi:hypothetical protein
MARIAVGGFQHETNTFAPQRASWADFERADAWPGFVRGPELIDAVEGFNIPIAGAVKTLQGLGHELVPLCWCSAPPSSHVEREAYEKVAGAILEDLAAGGPLDGIYLDLHGAMVAEHHEDGEGELLRRIRALVGDRIPIVTSLDYHTNLTPEMVRYASAMIGYRTYPHIDMAATGSRAAQLLDRLLKDRRRLYKAYRQIDFLIPLVWQCTLMEPAKGIFALIDDIERGSDKSGVPGGSHNQGIVSITHTPGFRPPISRNAARRWSSTAMTGTPPRPPPTASPRRGANARPGLPASSTRPTRRSSRRCASPKARRSRWCLPTSRTIPAPAVPRTRSGCCGR